MIWPSMVFNLCVGLLLAAYLLRAVRRFERTADAIMVKLDQWCADEMRKFDIARDEIKELMRVQVDAAIAEMEAKYKPPSVIVSVAGFASGSGSVVGTTSSTEQEVPTEEEIRTLPRWAQVAFTARCARRVVSLLPELWPLILADDLNTVEQSLAHVERVASTGELDPKIRSAFRLGVVDAAHQVAAKAHSHNQEVAAAVASAVANAMCAVYTGAMTAYSYATARGVEFISAKFDPPGRIALHIRRDFETVSGLAAAGSWTDDTPVPQSMFGPLWPEGPPDLWPKPEKPTTVLCFSFNVPDDMTTADAVEFVKELSVVLCELHLAGGGHGLAIQPPLEITVPARVPVGSR